MTENWRKVFDISVDYFENHIIQSTYALSLIRIEVYGLVMKFRVFYLHWSSMSMNLHRGFYVIILRYA